MSTTRSQLFHLFFLIHNDHDHLVQLTKEISSQSLNLAAFAAGACAAQCSLGGGGRHLTAVHSSSGGQMFFSELRYLRNVDSI